MARSSRGDSNGNASVKRVFSRDWFILIIFALALIAVVARLGYIQIIKADEYAEMADTAHTAELTLTAKRGTVYDRYGEVIAWSIEATTIYADTEEVTEPERVAEVLEKYLNKEYGKTYNDYYNLITTPDTSFVYIQRKADKTLASKLKKALTKKELKGIHYLEDTKRVYPNGLVGSQIIGAVDVDNIGIAGLEMQYNTLLGGEDGKVEIERGMYDIPIPDGVISRTEAVDGEDIITSVDMKLQQKTETSLLAACKEYKPQNASVTVMDAATGEIYATCSYSKSNKEYNLDVGKIWSISDAYEPGSTFKCITAAGILANNKKITPKTTFAVPSSLRVYDAVITDSHDHEAMTMSLRKIIADSSNMGMVLAARKVTNKQLYKTYSKFGFGKDPGTDFPGVASGLLEKSEDWDGVQQANITFGQGLSVTGMQIVRAYGALEQDGTLHVPHFLTSVPNNEEKDAELTKALKKSKTVAKKSVCDDVTSMMKSVVTGGTGEDAAIKGFTVAGKTGTAEVAGTSGSYSDNGYALSFCGWLEGSDCDLICLVVLDRPRTGESAGTVCGTVFADIMSFAADRYQVSPNAG